MAINQLNRINIQVTYQQHIVALYLASDTHHKSQWFVYDLTRQGHNKDFFFG